MITRLARKYQPSGFLVEDVGVDVIQVHRPDRRHRISASCCLGEPATCMNKRKESRTASLLSPGAQKVGRTTKIVVARLDRAIQYAAASRSTSNSSGILGRPVEPGDDGGVVAAVSRCRGTAIRAAQIVELIQQIDPTGKSPSVYQKSCQAPREKIFLFSRNANQSISLPHPVPLRGALRNVPARGGDAVDVDGAPDEGARSGRRNRVVLTPYGWCQVRAKACGRRWQ